MKISIAIRVQASIFSQVYRVKEKPETEVLTQSDPWLAKMRSGIIKAKWSKATLRAHITSPILTYFFYVG